MKTELKPFDLEAAKAGAPVVTRDRHSARIVCFDVEQDYSIVALIKLNDGKEYADIFTDKGAWSISHDDCRDLFMAPAKRNGWLNLYRRDGLVSTSNTGFIYKTEADALDSRAADYIATVPVEWEE